MGYTEKYLQRANIQFIQEFLKHGTCCMKLEKGSYEERISEAWKPVKSYLQTACPDEESEVTELVNAYSSVVEDVFMEIGLRAGMRLMSQVL